MLGKRFTLLVVLFAGFLLAGTAARADMPAQNFYWADVDAIAGAARAFPADAASAFKASLQKAVLEKGSAKPGLGPTFKSVQETDFFGAFVTLIKPQVEKGDVQTVNGFLKAVSEGKWIQGRLLARNGGEFVTILSLEAGSEGKYLFRQLNQAVNTGDWRGTTFLRPLGTEVRSAAAAGQPKHVPAEPAPPQPPQAPGTGNRRE